MGTTKVIQIISAGPVQRNVIFDTQRSPQNEPLARKATTSKLQHRLPIRAWIVAMLANGKMTITENVGPVMQIVAPVLARTKIIVSHARRMMQKLWMVVEFVETMPKRYLLTHCNA